MRLAALLVALAGLVWGAVPAVAQGVRVSPVAIVFPATSGAGSVRIENGRAAPVSFQIDVYRWTQDDGVDVLTPTRDIAAAPTVFELPPGAGRIVRVALAPGQRAAHAEQAFRLIARELPGENAPAGRARVVLELSLPVFATVRGAVPQVEVHREAAVVHVSNAGGAHMRLLDIKCEPSATGLARTPRYLLAGSRFSRPLSGNAAALRFSFLAAGDNDPVQQTHRLADIAAVDPHAR